MPFNGSGTFSIVNTYVPNTTILSAAVNQNFTDIATGLSDCLTRDNQAGMTAVFRAVSGAIGAPGISFNSDTTAGLYLPASGSVGLVAHSIGLILNTNVYIATAATVQAGGSGYAVGDTITATGGTAIGQPVFTVATVSGSAVATVTVAYSGFYTVTPSNPVAQGSTSGAGTGCTLNVTYNNPAGADYRGIFLEENGVFPWKKFGASSFVNGLMSKANGLAFALGIGGSNLATAIGGTLLIQPQGILSPISSTTAPIPTSDQTAVTHIYWTPYKGNVVPIYNGSQFVAATSAQIFCDLTAGAQASGGIYDVYMFLNAATPTLGFSPTWSAGTSGSVTAGSCARGTSTGGTALAVVNGIYVNAVSMTVNNGATTYTVGVNQGTYLGSVYIDSTAGQVNCHYSYGQSRVRGLWNAWNQVPIILKAGDSTASWAYNTNTIRASNNASANKITQFVGLPGASYDVQFMQKLQAQSNASAALEIQIGIGINSTSAFTGTTGNYKFDNNGTGGITDYSTIVSSYCGAPIPLGINAVQSLERTIQAGTTNAYFGTETFMLLSSRYDG